MVLVVPICPVRHVAVVLGVVVVVNWSVRSGEILPRAMRMVARSVRLMMKVIRPLSYIYGTEHLGMRGTVKV